MRASVVVLRVKFLYVLLDICRLDLFQNTVSVGLLVLGLLELGTMLSD